MLLHVRTALVVLALGLAAGIAGVAALGHGSDPAPAERSTTSPAPPTDGVALAVLREWDDRRAAAWASGDAAALSGLYVHGSAAGSADVALLRRYRARGLVVRDLRMQIQRARVLTNRPGRVVVEVTERLASAVAYVASTGARRLPRGGIHTRVLVLERGAGGWRVARVSAVAPDR